MQDHRRLGRELELFHSDPLIGAGLPIWLPDGAAARLAVEQYLIALERQAGYQHVYSPPMARPAMYERSGHLPHFADDMFPVMALSEDDPLVLRPSLCPHHAMVFRARGRSYRDLPLRVAEIGGMYRAERSGVLGGLSRVRAITLNDSHIFCTADRAADEVAGVFALMRRAHAALGFAPDGYRLSLPGNNIRDGGKYVDDEPMWQRGEAILREALAGSGLPFVEAPGEAAFYGPKVDVQIRDSAGREWTLATVQIDLHQPVRFDLSYVDADGQRRRPAMVHRSLVGSMERLFAHLIEVHEGAFPAWYAPVQVAVLPVGPAQGEAAAVFADHCRRAGLRVADSYEGTLGARVREAARRKVPFAAVIGEREAASGSVALRPRGGAGSDPDEPTPVESALRLLLDAGRPPDV